LLLCLTPFSQLQAETTPQEPNLELLAQWSLNHGSYLLDIGNYLEALEAFDTSLESSARPEVQTRALLSRAMTLATFLDAPDQAIEVYRRIRREYPKQAENATYREGLLLFDMTRYKVAISALEGYLRDYPKGRFRFQAEALLDQSRAELEKVRSVPHPPDTTIKQPRVRVLLFRKAPEVRLQGKGIQLTLGNIQYSGADNYMLAAENGQVRLAGSRRSSGTVEVRAQGPLRITASKSKKLVRGLIQVSAKGDHLRVINQIGIESYLRGVVPSESYASWPLETLRAQAVAARTYAFYQVRHRSKRLYDVVDNEGDQAYKGVEREDPRTDKAVTSTAGVILTDPKKKNLHPILAMYSANSGGHTADAKAIFRVDNSVLKAQLDPWSLTGKMANWKRRYSRAEIEKGLARVGVKVHQLRAIEPVTVGPSGRLIRVRLIHKGKPIEVRSRPVLTRALKLPEILVEIQPDGDKFIFNGHGWGHGVGYSQWGSAGMGKAGKDYREILAYYYPDTKLKRRW